MASLVIDAIDSMTIAAISAIESMANKASGDLLDRWAINAVEESLNWILEMVNGKSHIVAIRVCIWL